MVNKNLRRGGKKQTLKYNYLLIKFRAGLLQFHLFFSVSTTCKTGNKNLIQIKLRLLSELCHHQEAEVHSYIFEPYPVLSQTRCC